MKKLLFCLPVILCMVQLQAQNVGIRVANPAYPLTVGAADNFSPGVVQIGNGVQLALSGTGNAGSLLTLGNHPLNFSANGATEPDMTIATNGNVGIGLGATAPAYKLDIGGRMRLRHNGNSAGIWLEGTSFTNRAFMGTYTDQYTGLYGIGSGWNIVMDVNNGNTGIGTSAPTARLDIGGTLRWRQAGAVVGSVIQSTDANGNATWADPVAFKAQGSDDGNPTTIPSGVWTKVTFSTSPAYNLGFHYQVVQSQFVAPVRGIYHFNAQTTWTNRRFSVGIGMDGTRGGVAIANMPQYSYANGRTPKDGSYYNVFKPNVEYFETDLKLEAGDIVWLKVYRNTGDQLNIDPTKTWFAGRLVTSY